MSTVFIDWTEISLNIYVFDKQGGQYKMSDSRSVDIEGELKPESLNSLIKTGIDNIHLSIPSNLLTLREQSFPFSDKDKIKETISYKLQGILLGDTDDYSIDHIVIESDEIGSKVLAVCLEKIKLQEIIDMFSSAGLEPKVITSLDLRLSEGKGENLFGETTSDKEIRAEVACDEILNPSINLRQDELAYTGDIEKFKKSLRLTAILALILLIVLGAISTLRLITLNNEHKLLTNGMQGIYRQVFPEDKKIIDVERQLKGNINMLMKKKAALGGIPVLDMLRDIAVHKNNNITLYEFNADEKNVLIKGTAKSFEDVESLKKNLASAFYNVKVISSDASADKKINFTIIMQEKPV